MGPDINLQWCVLVGWLPPQQQKVRRCRRAPTSLPNAIRRSGSRMFPQALDLGHQGRAFFGRRPIDKQPALQAVEAQNDIIDVTIGIVARPPAWGCTTTIGK
jgi:hypothetical protein